MSFEKKTWVDRVSQYPTRRKIIDVDSGTESTVDVERAEGEISNPGTSLSAENFNDLEERIFNAIEECFQSASDGNVLVATAVAGMGVEIVAENPDKPTFSEIAASCAAYRAIQIGVTDEITLIDTNPSGGWTTGTWSIDFDNSDPAESELDTMELSGTGLLINVPLSSLVLTFTVPLRIGGFVSGDSQKNELDVLKNGEIVESKACNISSASVTRNISFTLTDLVAGDLITAQIDGISGVGCGTNGTIKMKCVGVVA